MKYSEILRKQCAWSPAIYCYQSAIFLHMMSDETGDERLREKINELYKEVPKLRIRYAGKTIPGMLVFYERERMSKLNLI